MIKQEKVKIENRELLHTYSDNNKYILQALTQFDELYGKKEGTLTHILFNSGLSIEQLSDAIQQYNGR